MARRLRRHGALRCRSCDHGADAPRGDQQGTRPFGYRAGASQWAVSHNSEHGQRDLEVSGSPPPVLAEIRDRLATLQDADDEDVVDYFFEAPLELVKAICGYRLDSGDAPVNVIWKLVEPLYDGRAGRGQFHGRPQRLPELHPGTRGKQQYRDANQHRQSAPETDQNAQEPGVALHG